MGTWGFGPFDNDGAADLLAFVDQAGSRGWSLVRDELDSGYPMMVIAAAELVAIALLGGGRKRDQRIIQFAIGNRTAEPWARKYARYMPRDLPTKALLAARKVAKSTHNIGWTKASSARAWDKTVASVIRRLERGMRRVSN